MARYIVKKQKTIEAFEYNDFTIPFRLPVELPFDSDFVLAIFQGKNEILNKDNPTKDQGDRKITFSFAKEDTEGYGGKDLYYELRMIMVNDDEHTILTGVFKLLKTLIR
jgi:hypothetical protein